MNNTSSLSADLVQKAAGLANRLRLVQIDFADDSPDIRQGQLEEEVERALAQVPIEQREAFLRELDERFPTWDQNVAVAPVPAPAAAAGASGPVQSVMDAKELRDPSFLVSRLLELGKGMTDEQRRAVGEALQRGGFSLGSGEWPSAAAEEVRVAVRADAGATLDPTRTVQSAALLATLATSLDRVAWRTLKEVSPRSPNTRQRSEEALRVLLSRYVTGDKEVSGASLKEDAERSRQLMAALISCLGKPFKTFAQEHAQRFLPQDIDGSVSGGMMANKYRLMWEEFQRRYQQHMSPDVLESEFRAKVSDFLKGMLPWFRES